MEIESFNINNPEELRDFIVKKEGLIEFILATITFFKSTTLLKGSSKMFIVYNGSLKTIGCISIITNIQNCHSKEVKVKFAKAKEIWTRTFAKNPYRTYFTFVLADIF